ncbi:MAG TPA: DUF559 domain-containing protein [Myxococcota bacterium]|nr:DUF559 domain-containing protein [Myxococcota bacterium]
MSGERVGERGASESQSRYDKIRSEFLRARGIKVLRFWNNDVLEQTARVLAAIWNEMSIIYKYSPLPNPLPAHTAFPK